MKRVARVALSFLVLSALGCGDKPATTQAETASTAQAPAPTETQRLHAWMDEKFAEELRLMPWRKAIYGIKDEDADRIGDFSAQGLDQILRWRQQTAAELQQRFDYDALTPLGKDSYDLWRYVTARAELEQVHIGNHYLFNQHSGRARLLPQILISLHQVDTAKDAADYVSRIRAAAAAVEQLTARARSYADGGVHAP